MKKLSLTFFLLSATLFLSAHIKPVNLTCEYLTNPPLIDTTQPRLAWQNVAGRDESGQRQTAYQIEVASSLKKLHQGKADLWQTGRVESDAQAFIHYGGQPLKSRQQCWWRVRVWDADGHRSRWSEPASWRMGILDASEWHARWIGAPWQGDEATSRSTDKEYPPAPLLRRDIELKKPVREARIYISGLGYFELYANGQRVSDDVLVPNQTNYGARPDLKVKRVTLDDNFTGYNVFYLSYDLTRQLHQGSNALGVILGNGFYNAISQVDWTSPYGSPRLMAQLYVTYKDGSEESFITDGSWRAKRSAITCDGIYQGELYDARLETPGWCVAGSLTTGSQAADWQPVALRQAPEGELQAQQFYADKVIDRLAPKTVKRLGDGHYLLDFGVEIAGWLHIKNVTGKAGQKIDIKYICESPVGTNSYTLCGNGAEDYHARFTWFVFRQVEVTGWPGELRPEQVSAELVHTQMPSSSHFTCSDTLLNHIERIWRQSFEDNAHGGIISDCPHRERSPYTGDGQVACVTAMHNYDTRPLYTKWLRDMRLAQDRATGFVPNGAPWQPGCGGGVGWGAAINIMPWEFYLHYGDTDMLSVNYEPMKAQVRHMLTWTDADGIMHQQMTSNGKVIQWKNIADWCPPYGYPTDALVHTYFLWRCADYTARTATTLGHVDDAATYRQLAERTRQAFIKRFWQPDSLTFGPYGANIFALAMGVPDDIRPAVVRAVKAELRQHDGHLFTGMFGTQLLFETLTDNGMNEEAYAALTKRDFPSFGWWLMQGATTTWEQWDGRNSHNHPMFGGGLTWLYRRLCGLQTDEAKPGFRHFTVRPYPPRDISWAEYSTETTYGEIATRWQKSDGWFTLRVQVPVGCTATIIMPRPDMGEGERHEVGQGTYTFTTNWNE